MKMMMRDLVQVQGNFKPSVSLPNDFFDENLNCHFVESYIPTQETMDIFLDIRDSLQPHSDRRARLFSGTFGTGKSDLMLMIANYVTRPSEDPFLAPFFKRLRNLNHAKAEAIYQARQGKPPFLLVLLQSDTAITFSSFVLDGLAGSLEKANLGDLLDKTYYRAALDLIETWEYDWPDNIRRLNEVLETNHGHTLNQLRHDLSGPHGDSALEVFRPAILQVTGMPFHPTAVVQRPAEAFSAVAERLPSDRYSGIFVIADEFTHLLQKLADSPTASDSKAIDNLAETADRSGYHQLHFYTVSLQSFASAQGSTKASQLALERSGGRFFAAHELHSQNMEELISASISKLIPVSRLFEGVQAQMDDLLTLATKLWGGRATGRRDREWLGEIVVRGCFPLHPLTTYCLPRLNAALAQNERTMFSFIWDRDRGLGHFIEEVGGEPEANGWLPLFSLDMLFTYFETNLKEKRPDLLLAYQQATSTMSMAQLEEGLEGRLLRALIMLEVAGGDPNLRTDPELLRHALGLAPAQRPDITAALERLEKDGIAYPSQSGYYQLVKPGRANPLELRRLVQQQAQDLFGSPIERLNATYKPSDVGAERYNSERGTARQLTAYFTNLSELYSVSAPFQALSSQDGLLWYVIATSEQELEQARSAALRLTRQHDQIVIAVPQKPVDLVTRLRRVLALEQLRADPNYSSSDYQALLVDNGLVGRDYLTNFQEALRLFDQPSKFEWFQGGRTVTVTTTAQLTELATAVMNVVFPATPMHRTRQHLKPTGKSKSLKDALNQILQEEVQQAEGKKSAIDAILMDGAYELGLIYYVDRRKGFKIFHACAPGSEQRTSQAVWLQIHEQLQSGVAWSAIIEKLMKRPYGLYPSVLELFIAAFYRCNRDYLEVYSTSGMNRPIDVTGDTVIDMVEFPNKYIVRYQPLTEAQYKFLRGLLERALYRDREFEIQRGDTASLRNKAARLLRWWMNSIPGIPHETTPDELESVLRNASQVILSLCVTLIEIAFKPEQAMTAADLLDRLPMQVGLSKDSSSWTDVALDQALAYLETACQQLQGFPRAFEADMAWKIGQLFGLTELPTNLNDILVLALRWRKEFVSAVQSTFLVGTPDARDLLRFLDDRPHSFEQVFLNALPSRWVTRPFGEWQSISIRDEYLLRLEGAKAAVEVKAAELGLPSSLREKMESVSAKRQDLQFSPSHVDLNSPSQPETKSSAAVKTNGASIVPKIVHEAQPMEKVFNAAKQSMREQTPQPKANITVDQAFATIKSIFDSLSPRDQRQLWEYLVQEYDPR